MNHLKQITTKEKIDKGRPITDHEFVMMLKTLFRPVLSFLVRTQIPYKVVIDRPCALSDSRPVIYAANHFCFADVPVMGTIAVNHSYILMGKQRLRPLDRLYCMLNGVIFVDRKDRSDMGASKKAIAAYLKKGQSVVMFPEGTWNLTDNRMILPMKWGMIDIAKETGAQIVPVVLEYNRDKRECSVCFGEALTCSPEADKKAAITALRDSMATIRWELWQRKGIFHRRELDMDKERLQMSYSIEEYPTIEWEYERSCVYRPYAEPEEVFEHLSHLSPCKENAFLWRKK